MPRYKYNLNCAKKGSTLKTTEEEMMNINPNISIKTEKHQNSYQNHKPDAINIRTQTKNGDLLI